MKNISLIVLTTIIFSLQITKAQSGVHQGQYQKNLTYKGPVTGDEIIYTLYLPPGYAKDKGPYPLIIFLHGAGGGNASSQVMQSYEAARKAGKIQDFVVVFPEKYGGTVWRNGAKGKRPETNVLKELLPYLENEYALTRNRGARTIMGFSMGAAGSIYWGAKHQPSGTGPAASPQESDGKKATPVKTAWSWPRRKTTHHWTTEAMEETMPKDPATKALLVPAM